MNTPHSGQSDKEQTQVTTVDSWLGTYADLEDLVGRCNTEEDLWLLAQAIANDAVDSTGSTLDTQSVCDSLKTEYNASDCSPVHVIDPLSEITSEFLDEYAENRAREYDLDNGPHGENREKMRMREIAEYVERLLAEVTGRDTSSE